MSINNLRRGLAFMLLTLVCTAGANAQVLFEKGKLYNLFACHAAYVFHFKRNLTSLYAKVFVCKVGIRKSVTKGEAHSLFSLVIVFSFVIN